MRADIATMIERLDAQFMETNRISMKLEQIIDRGNRPTISMVDSLGRNNAHIQLLLADLMIFTEQLAASGENVPNEEIQALKESLTQFQLSQMQHGKVIQRLKNELGFIL